MCGIAGGLCDHGSDHSDRYMDCSSGQSGYCDDHDADESYDFHYYFQRSRCLHIRMDKWDLYIYRHGDGHCPDGCRAKPNGQLCYTAGRVSDYGC